MNYSAAFAMCEASVRTQIGQRRVAAYIFVRTGYDNGRIHIR